jgi:hypothetical protein
VDEGKTRMNGINMLLFRKERKINKFRVRVRVRVRVTPTK